MISNTYDKTADETECTLTKKTKLAQARRSLHLLWMLCIAWVIKYQGVFKLLDEITIFNIIWVVLWFLQQ